MLLLDIQCTSNCLLILEGVIEQNKISILSRCQRVTKSKISDSFDKYCIFSTAKVSSIHHT